MYDMYNTLGVTSGNEEEAFFTSVCSVILNLTGTPWNRGYSLAVRRGEKESRDTFRLPAQPRFLLTDPLTVLTHL